MRQSSSPGRLAVPRSVRVLRGFCTEFVQRKKEFSTKHQATPVVLQFQCFVTRNPCAEAHRPSRALPRHKFQVSLVVKKWEFLCFKILVQQDTDF